jgi:hypothetical protein
MRVGPPFLFCISLASAVAAASHVDAGGYVILVNQSNSVTSMTRSEMKRAAMGGTKQWSNGAVVQVGIIPSDAPETQYFASLVDLSPRELLARIQEAVFKGELRRPAVLRSSADCVAFARSNPGAFCAASDGEPEPPEVHVVVVR